MTDTLNVRAIQSAVESENLGWKVGSNELTAMSDADRAKRLGLIVSDVEMARLKAETNSLAAAERSLMSTAVGAPAAVDWRNKGGNWVTSVKDQGGCGSCVAFCSCSTIESAVRIKLANANYAIDLSEGFLQFCGGGSCGGGGLTSGLAFAKSTVVVDEACMPYTAGNGQNMNCASARCSNWQSRLTKISSYTGYSTMQARKDALATKGPLLAGMAVYNDFFAYASGVYVKSASTALAGYHCICCVGYDDNQQCWILKNSWGAGWGDNGFVRVRYNQPALLIDTDWSMYSVDVQVGPVIYNNITVSQVYSTPHSKNGWAYLQGIGWRRIHPNANDGHTNTLAMFAIAVAKGRKVTVNADGSYIYQAYLL